MELEWINLASNLLFSYRNPVKVPKYTFLRMPKN